MITCRCCHIEKQDSEFYYKAGINGKVYRRKSCIQCDLEYQNQRRCKLKKVKLYYKEIQSITNAVKAMIPRHKGIKVTWEQVISTRLVDKSIGINNYLKHII